MRSGLDAARRLAASLASCAAVIAASATMTACGDGDSGGMPLADCSQAHIEVVYPDLVANNSIGLAGQAGAAVVGQAFSSGVPSFTQISGEPPLPAACTASPTWTATGLPPGLAMDPATGAITGTPTSGGLVIAQFAVRTPGGTGQLVVNPSVAFLIRDPATALVNDWGAGGALPSSDGQLAAQGGDLVEVSAGAHTMQVARSVDGGVTWTTDAAPGAPPADVYSVVGAPDGTLYLAGMGTPEAPLATFWRYDGSAWQQQAAQTPFVDPQGPGTVYATVTGLVAVREDLNTVWRSQDGGATWDVATTAAFGGEGGFGTGGFFPLCAGELADRQVVVTTMNVFGTGQTMPVHLWESSDGGATWSRHAEPGTGPFTAIGDPARCFFAGGRLYIPGQGIYTVGLPSLIASADLDRWDYQATLPDPQTGYQGTAALAGLPLVGIDGRLFTGTH